MKDCSRLVKMKITNIGCIGPDGVEVALDQIVCLVGANNSGKSTVLRAYEAAVTMAELKPDEIHSFGSTGSAVVELWIHIPAGTLNIDEKWKEPAGELLLVRSKWTWPTGGGKPTRATWDPDSETYSPDANAAGLDTVFSSRLPKPLHIGSLQDPANEHRELLNLVLEPLKATLNKLTTDQDSAVHTKMQAVRVELEKPVEQFRSDVAAVVDKVNTSYRRVFSTAEVVLSVSLGDLTIDPAGAVAKASRVEVKEDHGQTSWNRQGTGSQRALFWSMLEVRSELKRIEDERRQREKDDADKQKQVAGLLSKIASAKTTATKEKHQKTLDELQAAPKTDTTVSEALLPGYMLLIDEPETALHPSALRAAKEHLYALADGVGWQVMLSTHHPGFVDPLGDHTTIVRLHRSETHSPPNVYRADEMHFSADEKQNLKSLLAFDTTVAEMFFGPPVVIVEGDTEFAAFSEVMNRDPVGFPYNSRPLVLRARGKSTIPTLVKVLDHFKVDFAVLHDIDSPRIRAGAKANSAYGVNSVIADAIAVARSHGRRIVHRCSCPDFERHHGMCLPNKDKPYKAWTSVSDDESLRASVRTVLEDLRASASPDQQDGSKFQEFVMAWAKVNAPEDPAFTFKSS